MPYSVVSLYHSYIILYVTITDFCNFYFNLSHQFLYPVHGQIEVLLLQPIKLWQFFLRQHTKNNNKQNKRANFVFEKNKNDPGQGLGWVSLIYGFHGDSNFSPQVPKGFQWGTWFLGQFDVYMYILRDIMISCSQGATSFLVSKRQLDF